MKPIFALLAFALALPATAAADVRDDLQRFFNEVNTYKAQFRQTVLDEGLNTLQETSGSMWISRPNKFRWEYQPPYRQTIVGDGEKIWVYDHDLEQITVRKMEGALGDTPAILLAGEGNLEETFDVKALGPQGNLQWVQMVPHRKDGGFEDIRIGFEDGRIRTLELVDALGQITRIVLSEGEENPEVDEGRFRFEPPAGVDVIRDNPAK